MARERLRGARLKIERAEQHIQDVECAWGDFLKSDPYTRTIEHNFDTPGRGLEVAELLHIDMAKASRALDRINCAAGDAIHNLRSALDHLAFQLAKRYGKLSRKELQSVDFPVVRVKKRLFATTKKHPQIPTFERWFGTTAFRQLLGLQPYKRGNRLLWPLTYLDIVDKHRHMIELGHLIGQKKVPVNPQVRGFAWNIEWRWQSLKKDVELYRLPPDVPISDLDNNPGIVLDIAFRKPKAIQGRPAPMVLHEFKDLVKGIVRIFEPLL